MPQLLNQSFQVQKYPFFFLIQTNKKKKVLHIPLSFGITCWISHLYQKKKKVIYYVFFPYTLGFKSILILTTSTTL